MAATEPRNTAAPSASRWRWPPRVRASAARSAARASFTRWPNPAENAAQDTAAQSQTPPAAAEPAPPPNEKTPARTGVFTSAIISQVAGHTIALFATGPRHAGENLERLLELREAGRGQVIQMCDALSRNVPKSFQTLVGNCLAHGRRRFVDVVASFPEECRRVLLTLREVYGHDAHCHQQGLSPPQRLAWHQQHSGPVLAELQSWMKAQLEERLVEPNSGLGEAIRYMLKHYSESLFIPSELTRWANGMVLAQRHSE